MNLSFWEEKILTKMLYVDDVDLKGSEFIDIDEVQKIL